MLNKAGLDCDVICYDYYHIMGCPEWEDADFEGDIKDQFYPNWTSVNLNGFKRPRWFAQGPLLLCIYCLIARRDGKKLRARLLWSILEIARFVRCSPTGVAVRNCLRAVRNFLRFMRNNIQLVRNYLFAVRIHWFPLGRLIFYSILFVCIPFIILFYLPLAFVVLPVKIIKLIFCWFQSIESEECSFEDYTKQLVKDFAKKFPGRVDKLTENDLMGYKYVIAIWRKLFSRYDIIHAYATDGIYPLLADVPYVAYEHGTIRNIPFEQTTQGRLCALTYKLADHVCITNADNIEAVKKLGLNNYRFVHHPVNEEFLTADKKSEELSVSLRARLDSDFIVFHPSRQHWEKQRHPDWEKGNDIFIRGLARFVKEVNPKAGAVFVEWGKYVNQSKKLLEELNIADRIMWISPQPNRRMVRYIHATDLVADQFHLGAFGSTMPKALACGKPAMLYLNLDVHKWCFDEMPPIIDTRTEQEVFEGLTKVYMNKEWVSKIAEEGKSWYQRYHSNEVVLNRLLSVYKAVLPTRGGN
ncbi:MAG: glycosyltransferase [Planctomycetota bacterium]